MRRIALTALILCAAALVIALPATGDDGTSGEYLVRGYFDNGGFIVKDEEVRVAGATVGVVKSVDVSRDDEVVSADGHTEPGKAVVVMSIAEDGFKDFREDASCIIRPQSLIGERFVDCTPTTERAPGSEPPPELELIADGQPGEGQRLLPLENNGKTVDLDLINNIQRAPYRDRFRLILNDLGAGLAARGDDLGAIIDRANPALRNTDRVLKILADQNRRLASLASDGDAVLEPLARYRTSITGFFANAATAGQATAERGDDLEAGLNKLPATLRETRLAMGSLKDFADQGTPVLADLGAAAPAFALATRRLGPFAEAGIPAFQSLGDAADQAGPDLVEADPLIRDLSRFSNGAVPIGRNLKALLKTFNLTNGFKYLTDFIYNTGSSVNGFDSLGHYQRSRLLVTTCSQVFFEQIQGCQAQYFLNQSRTQVPRAFSPKAASAPPSIQSVQGPAAEQPETQAPATTQGELDESIPELDTTTTPGPDAGTEPAAPGTTAPGSTDTGSADTGSADAAGTGQGPAAGGRSTASGGQKARDSRAPKVRTNAPMDLSDASVFLDFLLGGGA